MILAASPAILRAPKYPLRWCFKAPPLVVKVVTATRATISTCLSKTAVPVGYQLMGEFLASYCGVVIFLAPFSRTGLPAWAR